MKEIGKCNVSYVKEIVRRERGEEVKRGKKAKIFADIKWNKERK